MFIPCAVLLIMFSYVPMAGIVLSFKDFYPKLGIFNSPFVDPWYKYFEQVFTDYYFWEVFKNTVILSFLRILFGFPCTVILALLFNELRTPKYAKFVQTILFIPYFISWIVMSGMIKTIFGVDGLVNSILINIGAEKINFLTASGPFLVLLIFTEIFKTSGYGMIVYLAAISSIDNSLYEAVEIDGGNRLHKMWIVTLPGIKSTLAIQLILSVSGVLNGGFDQIFNLYSAPVYDVADIIDTYVYRIGIDAGKVEFGTALGLFKSVVSLILVLLANKIAKWFGGEGIW
jgi:putative aldouronate transport system permease protein